MIFCFVCVSGCTDRTSAGFKAYGAKSCFSNNFPYSLSTQIAPNGAVIRIASTATVSTIFPHGNPIDSGTAPIAACTVALGVYANAQNTRSFLDKSIFKDYSIAYSTESMTRQCSSFQSITISSNAPHLPI